MSDNYRYHRALSLALKEGKRLNLPVVKQTILDIVVLWLPPRGINGRGKRTRRGFADR